MMTLTTLFGAAKLFTIWMFAFAQAGEPGDLKFVCTQAFEDQKIYEEIPWRIPSERPEGVFEIDLPTNDTDLWLWEKTQLNGKVEHGVFELFDGAGSRLFRSHVIVGSRHHIEASDWLPAWDELWNRIAEFDGARPLTIRFSHTHPETGLVFHGGKMAVATPETLSPQDVMVTTYWRAEIDRLLLAPSFSRVGLKIDLEVASFTMKEVTLGDIVNLPLSSKVRALFGRYPPVPIKSTIAFPQ